MGPRLPGSDAQAAYAVGTLPAPWDTVELAAAVHHEAKDEDGPRHDALAVVVVVVVVVALAIALADEALALAVRVCMGRKAVANKMVAAVVAAFPAADDG